MTYSNIKELIEKAEKERTAVSNIIIKNEMKESNLSKREILDKISERLTVMKKALKKGINKDNKTISGLVGEDANKFKSEKIIGGGIYHRVIQYSLAIAEVNASMGKIVAGPTAGSSGIIPSVILAAGKEFNLNDNILCKSLITASGLGELVSRKVNLSGAAAGCQAECGVASGMAAAALVELCQGTPVEAGNAFSLALKNLLGLVCDPVAGLVEVPCVKRNSFAATHAVTAAKMALADIKSVIPPDEVVMAMREIGELLPSSLKETSEAGLAATPTGKELKKSIFANNKS